MKNLKNSWVALGMMTNLCQTSRSSIFGDGKQRGVTMLNENVREKLLEVYGPNPPVQCLARLEEELIQVHEKKQEDDTLLFSKLREAADCEIDAGFNSGASFLNWLVMGTRVNPLPPHYCCPVCKKAVFFSEGDGWDLPVLVCCGRPLLPDGHSIPFESIRQSMENPNSQLEFRIPQSFAEKAVGIIREHYAGRYCVIPVSTQFDHEFCFALVPVEDEQPPLDEHGVWQTDSYSIYRMHYRIVKLFCEEEMCRLKELDAGNSMKAALNDLLTAPVLEAARKRLEMEIQESADPDEPWAAAKPLLCGEKLSFSLLVRMEGYLRAVYHEDNPALSVKDTRYSDVFTCREDVWDLVSPAVKTEYGVSQAFAGKVTKFTRTGRFTNGRMDVGTEHLLRELGISDYWIAQMKHTCYLPAKAEIIGSLLRKMQFAWYELIKDGDK